jgi:acyl-ACP thioesterase
MYLLYLNKPQNVVLQWNVYLVNLFELSVEIHCTRKPQRLITYYIMFAGKKLVQLKDLLFY